MRDGHLLWPRVACPRGVSGPRPELRVDSRDVCFSLDYGWRVLLDPPMPAGRFTETPPDQSLVRHGAGALWCLQRFGDSRRCEKSGRTRRARPGRRRIPRPALSSGSASPSPVRGRLTRLRARSAYGGADGSIRGTASSVPCGEFRGWAARGKWVGGPVCVSRTPGGGSAGHPEPSVPCRGGRRGHQHGRLHRSRRRSLPAGHRRRRW